MTRPRELLPSRPAQLRTVLCKGTPYSVGHAHGTQAADLISGSITFYASMFEEKAGVDWSAVKQIAASFHETIQKRWPRYDEEMRGIATGACVSILDIVAINVRTEIAYGLWKPLVTDGCTTAYYKHDSRLRSQAWQGQNWDWQPAQAPNLVYLILQQEVDGNVLPEIKMISEAGIIGKIGINSRGVGVCFNALALQGCDYEGLPAHLALRLALEADSAQAARQDIIQESGGGRMASCAFILAGDWHGAQGCEFASTSDGSDGTVWQEPEQLDHEATMLVHANNCLMQHPRSKPERGLLNDSPARTSRMRELVLQKRQSQQMDEQAFVKLFEDEQGFPRSINRKQLGDCRDESLFNIVISYDEHGSARARVKMGRPTNDGEAFEMKFGDETN